MNEDLMSYLRLLLKTTALPQQELFIEKIERKRVYDHVEVKELDLER